MARKASPCSRSTSATSHTGRVEAATAVMAFRPPHGLAAETGLLAGQPFEQQGNCCRRRMLYVQILRGGAEVAMAQQGLHRQQVDPRFQQMSGEAVPQRVRMHGLAQPGAAGGASADPLHRAIGQGACRLGARKQPGRRSILTPVIAPHLQQPRRHRHQPLLLSFAVANVQHQAGAIDVPDL